MENSFHENHDSVMPEEEKVENYITKGLDYILSLDLSSREARPMLPGALTGVDTPKAWELRNKILTESITDPEYLIDSIAGLDSKEAWDFRNKLIEKQPDLYGKVIRSLAGIDTERAWKIRNYSKNIPEVEPDDLAQSLIGLTSKESFDLRRELLEKGASPATILTTLGGIDIQEEDDLDKNAFNPGIEARKLRNEFIDNETYNYAILDSIVGLDTDYAWDIREKAMEPSEKYVYGRPASVLYSLAGVDSSRSWDFRNKYKNNKNYYYEMAYSLAGLDSPESWEMRKYLQDNGLNPGALAQSVFGHLQINKFLIEKAKRDCSL